MLIQKPTKQYIEKQSTKKSTGGILINAENLKTKETKKITSLQALRGIAFLGIVSCHSNLSLLGQWSTTLFFVLSGFVLIYSSNNKTIAHSLKESLLFSFNKIKKLYPLYFITLVFYFFFNKVRSLKIILLNVFLLQSWVPGEKVCFSMNGVAWFYSDLLFIYCMFPLIKYIIDKYKSKKTVYTVMILGSVILYAVSIVLNNLNYPDSFPQNFSGWSTYIFPVFRLGEFVFGCNLGYFFINTEFKIKKLPLTLLELFTGVMFVAIQIITYKNGRSENLIPLHLFHLTNAALAIILFSIKGGLFTKICSNKLLIFIGNLSGYGFLIHKLVIDVLYSTFSKGFAYSPRIKNIVVFLMSTVITIGLSYAYSKAEKAIRRKLKH